MNNVAKLEPKAPSRIGKARNGGGGLHKRVEALEGRMTAVEATAQTAATKATEAAENTAQLLTIITATKGVAAFAKKHGPRFVAFLTGILATYGIGNPEILILVRTFFGA